jgi:hypothetical protein
LRINLLKKNVAGMVSTMTIIGASRVLTKNISTSTRKIMIPAIYWNMYTAGYCRAFLRLSLVLKTNLELR